MAAPFEIRSDIRRALGKAITAMSDPRFVLALEKKPGEGQLLFVRRRVAIVQCIQLATQRLGVRLADLVGRRGRCPLGLDPGRLKNPPDVSARHVRQQDRQDVGGRWL